jgi:lysyl-tRNA synthetase class 1
MSSSKGVGSSAKEIAALLPPQLLRFLMLRTQPKTVINFAPNYETTTRLFRDYDTLIEKYQALSPLQPPTALPEELKPLLYAQLDGVIKPYHPVELSTLISLLQVPHLDLHKEITTRSTQPLNEYDWETANQRIAVAQKWLADYADEEEKLVIYLDEVPEKVKDLTQEQMAYLKQLIHSLANVQAWEAEALQTALFATARELEMQQPLAFKAVYLSFLGKERGPKAGALLSYLERDFTLDRLKTVTASFTPV